jgi:hypothetical protein
VVAGVAGLAGAPAAVTATQVNANVTSNATWTAAGSPYMLNAEVRVAAGVTLTLAPGIVVAFNQTGTSTDRMWVDGSLVAAGSSGNAVEFTSAEALSGAGAPGQYSGVAVNPSSTGSRFSYVEVRYGGSGSTAYAYGALTLSASAPVDHVTFEYNQSAGLHVDSEAVVDVSSSTFMNNGDGVSVTSATLHLWGSVVQDNAEDGVYVLADSTTARPSSSIVANDISGNGAHGVQVTKSCSDPLSTFPHGQRNNIWGNGGAALGADQLHTTFACPALLVNWDDNFWGSDVYWRRNLREASCDVPGHLSYTWAAESAFQAPAGPLTSSSDPHPTDPAFQHYLGCGTDTFYIGPWNWQTAYMADHLPSLSAAGIRGYGPDGAPNLAQSHCADPVNCATGNFHETVTDLEVPGLNGGLTFARTYNAQGAAEARTRGALGYGWTFTFGDQLKIDADSVTVTESSGSEVRFYAATNGTYWAAPWVQAILVRPPPQGDAASALHRGHVSAMSYCNHLARWTESHADEISRYGSYVLNVSNDDRDKRSAHLALETAAGFVELIVWDSGEAEFAFGPFQDATDEHHEMTSLEHLDGLLVRFVEQATELGGE